MVGLGGLELPTSPLSGVRSNHLSYRPNYHCILCHLSCVAVFVHSVTYVCTLPLSLNLRLASRSESGAKSRD